jgi:hypothetical protein
MRFWDEDALDGASKTVHVHVWRLRKALGDPDLIATTPAGYCLRVQPDELDPASFERLLDDGRQAGTVEPGPRLRELQQAILRHDAALKPRADGPAVATERDPATVTHHRRRR